MSSLPPAPPPAPPAAPLPAAPPPPAGSAYNVSALLASAPRASAGGLLPALSAAGESPCFRPAAAWAAVVGGLLGAHRLRVGGGARRAASDALLGWSATAGTQYFFCRRDEHDRRLALRAYYATQAALQAGRGADGEDDGAPPPAAAPPAAPGAGAPPPPPAADAPPWRAELERLVRYDLPTVERGPDPPGTDPRRGAGFTIS